MKRILIIFIILTFSFKVFGDESLVQIKQKLEKIERDISDLQVVVFSKKNKVSIDDNNNQDVNGNITIFDMRLRDIEGELQSINLNYENISFEISDLKNTLQELALELNNAIIQINTRLDNRVNTDIDNQNILESKQIENIEKNEQKNTLGILKISSNDLSESKEEEINEEKISY